MALEPPAHSSPVYSKIEEAGPDYTSESPHPGWRPLSLQPPFFFSVIGFTLGLIVILGVLEWLSVRHGALYVSETAITNSSIANVAFQYFPTIVAVVYSAVWNWIDLDIKRLEPWFQLSGNSGSSPKDSVLLQYPVDFVALVPIKAARRK